MLEHTPVIVLMLNSKGDRYAICGCYAIILYIESAGRLLISKIFGSNGVSTYKVAESSKYNRKVARVTCPAALPRLYFQLRHQTRRHLSQIGDGA